VLAFAAGLLSEQAYTIVYLRAEKALQSFKKKQDISDTGAPGT
jgi:hypothetical protein